jgi:hypothetical protein
MDDRLAALNFLLSSGLCNQLQISGSTPGRLGYYLSTDGARRELRMSCWGHTIAIKPDGSA